MRLVSARVRGAGRLVDTTIRLDQKVIAIVGPNEAGKSTLLKAMAYPDAGGDWPPPERSRSAHVADTTHIVSLQYVLDEDDRAEVEDLELFELPNKLYVSRAASGGDPHVTIAPAPRKDEGALQTAVTDLGTALDGASVLTRRAGEEGDGEAGDETDDGSDLLASIRDVKAELDTFLSADPSERADVQEMRARTDAAVTQLADYEAVEGLAEPLRQIFAWVDRDDPTTEVQKRLWSLTPDVLMFEEGDRNLVSAYVLDDNLIANVPPALEHLARLAGLDLAELVELIKTNQVARRNTLRNKANQRLAEVFNAAWYQIPLTVDLNIENNVLRIGLLEDGVHASLFEDRSAGLRMFVALTAFLADRDTGRPTVLLIDEAETHLHINAQADLVNMFAQQTKADKIIYTTHSPACLPADLGVGIRAVVPDSDEVSHVENSFWKQDGGPFTSLMFAMGASAAAFTPARCAVIAEGPSDMILLPSLVRAATRLDRLPYQVAPGLSEMPPDFYPNLDFEAARVAFLVDGDDGGESLAKRLGRAAPPERIVNLGVPGVENVIDPDFYRATFVSLLREWNPGANVPEPPALPSVSDAPWAGVLQKWAGDASLTPPTKVAVASRMIEDETLDISQEGATLLKAVHEGLLAALEIGE